MNTATHPDRSAGADTPARRAIISLRIDHADYRRAMTKAYDTVDGHPVVTDWYWRQAASEARHRARLQAWILSGNLCYSRPR